MRINIISHKNLVGLSVDIDIIQEVLSEHTFNFIEAKKLSNRRPADVNIFLELVDPRCFRLASYNVFIPNPEWFWEKKHLKSFDLVLVKTRDAERIFKGLGCDKVIYTSFTSKDRYIKDVQKSNHYLHLAGKSSMKGTKTVFNVWEKNHDFQPLILGKIENYREYMVSRQNIWTFFKRLPESSILQLQNKCRFHICTSEYEGFGHYIHEAKSAGAVIITTDAPPMNEFITKDMGYHVAVAGTERYNLGTLSKISAGSLERVIKETMGVNEKELDRMGKAARQSFVDNDKFFRSTLKSIFKNL